MFGETVFNYELIGTSWQKKTRILRRPDQYIHWEKARMLFDTTIVCKPSQVLIDAMHEQRILTH